MEMPSLMGILGDNCLQPMLGTSVPNGDDDDDDGGDHDDGDADCDEDANAAAYDDGCDNNDGVDCDEVDGGGVDGCGGGSNSDHDDAMILHLGDHYGNHFAPFPPRPPEAILQDLAISVLGHR